MIPFIALLPYLPMSPGDFKLIGQGAMRGSLVQFDRGDLNKLGQFVTAHKSEHILDFAKDIHPFLFRGRCLRRRRMHHQQHQRGDGEAERGRAAPAIVAGEGRDLPGRAEVVERRRREHVRVLAEDDDARDEGRSGEEDQCR